MRDLPNALRPTKLFSTALIFFCAAWPSSLDAELHTDQKSAQSPPATAVSPQEQSESVKGAALQENGVRLKRGTPVERALRGGETQTYRIRLEAGQFLHVAVQEKGIHVVVVLKDPDGKTVAESNSLTGWFGVEGGSFIAKASGEYRASVWSNFEGAPSGKYEIKVVELRIPVPEDHQRIAAERGLKEGAQLAFLRQADSMRNGISKWQEALLSWKQLSDGYEEALTLHNMGMVYIALWDLPKALECFNQALATERKIGDHAGEAATLLGIGMVHGYSGEKESALDYYRQAQSRDSELGDRPGEAVVLNNIGILYATLGDKRKALDCYIQAAKLVHSAGASAMEAVALSNIGAVYDDLGEKQKALEYYDEALPLLRINNPHGVAIALSNIAKVHSNLGEDQKALRYYGEALNLQHAAGDPAGEATTLSNMGMVYDNLGEKQKALEHYSRALPLRRAAQDRGGEAITLSNIGAVYDGLGEKQRALEYYKQALELHRAVRDRTGEATTLSNMGNVYAGLGEKEKALEYFQQALPLRRSVSDRSGEAVTLSNIGWIYDRFGEKEKALEYFNEALALEHAVGDRKAEAWTLTNIGSAYFDLGQKPKALEHLNRALSLERAIRDPTGEGTTLAGLAEFWKSEKRPRLAIFFGKQAVNSFQQIRGNIQGLEKATQKSYVASVEGAYRKLASLLIDEGRLGEAEQVLNLLKLEEYNEFTRGASQQATSSATASLELTPEEMESDKRYRKATEENTTIGEEWARLRAKQDRTKQEERQLIELSAKVAEANDAFIRFLDELTAELGKPVARTVQKEVSGLQRVLRNLDSGTVALYTVVSEQKLQIIVVTRNVMEAREVTIAENELRSKVFAFREALLNPESNPLPLAQELYKLLLSPVDKDLEAVHATTLMWSLDDALRYIPMAALHDGKGYAVEKYSMETFTPASVAQLAKPKVGSWRGLGVGVSKSYGHFEPLPAVTEELHSIIRGSTSASEGVLPGEILLDEHFTKESLEKALEEPYPVVHIASHFAFRPGNETDSYLLLGGTDDAGEQLTLAEIRRNPNIDFQNTEVLTLSACNTATAGEARGKEIDGLGFLLEEKGAKSVVATLWSVADTSTGKLMKEFYQGWTGASPVSKAEALRQAQLFLLYGPKPVGRTAPVGTSPASTSEAPSAHPSFAHPFYWAPFILIGNWR